MSELNKYQEKFPIGNVVYFSKTVGCEKYVSFGTVEELYADAICIQLYDLPDERLINGIPIKDFVTPTPWKKLPKDWTYNTSLYNVTYAKPDKKYYSYSINNPDDILRAIKDGVLTKIQDNGYESIETEIDKNKGWRLIRKYSEYRPYYISLQYDNVYSSYDEAKRVIEDYEKELKRQSELSDYEWSLEKITENLNRWAKLYSISDEKKEQYLKWILKLSNLEDVETRIIGGNFQWKYWKNKKWMNIEL